MLKKERQIGKDKYWQIHGNEFCDVVSLHLALSNYGFSISPEVQEILNNESTQFHIIEQQINQVGKTLMLLGNGYFPSIVSIHRISKNSPKQNIRQEFQLDFHYMRNDQNVEESNVITLDNTLDELFDWSYNYVKVFSKYPKIFEDDYWNNQILEMISTCKKNLLVYNQLNTLKTKRYFLPQSDGSEINLLQFENEHSKTTLRIQNEVH